MALIRESEFSRGYFVGGLGRRDGEEDKEEEIEDGLGGNYIDLGASAGREQIGNAVKTKKKTQLGNNIKKNSVDESESSSSSSSSSSVPSSPLAGSSPVSPSSPAAWKGGVQGDWYGDRIEILVGSGDVYLQFEDENEDDDPFCRTRGLKKEVGFWKRFFSYSGFFL